MSDAALRAPLCLPCSCFSDTFLPALSLLRRFPRQSIRRFPLCEGSLAGRPAFSRVGSYTGLRFCIAPPDNTLRAPLYLPCSCFSDTFLPVLSPLRRFPRPAARRFPFCGDCPVGSSGASPFVKIPSSAARLFPCRRLHRPALLHCAPGQYPARLALPSIFMLFRHVPSGAFPSTEISPSGRSALSSL